MKNLPKDPPKELLKNLRKNLSKNLPKNLPKNLSKILWLEVVTLNHMAILASFLKLFKHIDSTTQCSLLVLFPLLWLRAMWWWEPQEPPKTSMTAKPASAAAAYIQRRLDYVGLKNFQILRLSKTATPQKQTQTFDYSSKLFWVRVASSYYRFCCCSAVFLRIFHSQAMWQMTAKKSCGAWKKMMEVGSFLALLAVFVQFFTKKSNAVQG